MPGTTLFDVFGSFEVPEGALQVPLGKNHPPTTMLKKRLDLMWREKDRASNIAVSLLEAKE